jgi:tetratricopeptide (TPR) repeat protein
MAKQPWYNRLWKRLIITTIVLLVVAFCLGWLIWGSKSSSIDIVLALLAGIGVLVAVGQWVFPFSSEKPEQLILPYARELVRESASFRMGDTTAANFDYITEPIKNAYDTARQALHDASIGAGSKRGILILGIANAGKTRLAFEALTQTLPNWKVLLWNAAYDRPSEVPAPTVSRSSGFVVFIDDLQEYVPPESFDADVRGFVSDNRIATLQAFLHNMQTKEHMVVVATCRLEDETRVGARLRWLFDQLKVIALPSFRVEATDPESANIIDLFQQHGATDVGDWDGTLGSLVLGLSKKRSQYEDLVQSRSPVVTVLRAMKLLSLALIPVHTHSRIQGVRTGVFGEPTLREGTKTWQNSVDQLTRLEFVTEVKAQASGKYALVIRKDTYFDQVITDYPAPNRPYQLDQHFEQLQKVLVGLHDSSALVNLAKAYFNLKRYEEALAALEQAIRLDPNLARAYNGKGIALGNLKRYEEALAAYEQAIRLDPTDPLAYYNKGIALHNLKRYEEALAALEQAIRLDPNLARAYNGKGTALGNLKRYEEALAAYEQVIRLDPTNTDAYTNKGAALGDLKRYEEALAALEQAIRLDPNYTLAYYNKGTALGNLKRYEEALAAYEQAIRLDPTNTDAYTGKEELLRMLGREGEA